MATPRYASTTEVSVDRSTSELQAMLKRYGSTRYRLDESSEGTAIIFEMKGRYVRLLMPTIATEEINTSEKGYKRNAKAAEQALDREIRRRWRVMVILVKSKLEAVNAGFSTFEHEFLADTVVEGTTTVGDMLSPKLEVLYKTGKMPKLPSLLLGSGK